MSRRKHRLGFWVFIVLVLIVIFAWGGPKSSSFSAWLASLDIFSPAHFFSYLSSFFMFFILLALVRISRTLRRRARTQHSFENRRLMLKALEHFNQNPHAAIDREKLQIGLSTLKGLVGGKRQGYPRNNPLPFMILARFFVQHLKDMPLKEGWMRHYEQHPRDFYEIGVIVKLINEQRETISGLFYDLKDFARQYERVYETHYQNSPQLLEGGKKALEALIVALLKNTQNIEEKNGASDNDFELLPSEKRDALLSS